MNAFKFLFEVLVKNVVYGIYFRCNCVVNVVSAFLNLNIFHFCKFRGQVVLKGVLHGVEIRRKSGFNSVCGSGVNSLTDNYLICGNGFCADLDLYLLQICGVNSHIVNDVSFGELYEIGNGYCCGNLIVYVVYVYFLRTVVSVTGRKAAKESGQR